VDGSCQSTVLLLAQQVVEGQEKGSVGTPEELGLELWNEQIKARVEEAILLWEYRNWMHAPCFAIDCSRTNNSS